jgi:hypothetical protein
LEWLNLGESRVGVHEFTVARAHYLLGQWHGAYPRDGPTDSEQKISTTLTQGRSKRARFFFGTIGSAVPQRRDTVRVFCNSLPILDV